MYKQYLDFDFNWITLSILYFLCTVLQNSSDLDDWCEQHKKLCSVIKNYPSQELNINLWKNAPMFYHLLNYHLLSYDCCWVTIKHTRGCTHFPIYHSHTLVNLTKAVQQICLHEHINLQLNINKVVARGVLRLNPKVFNFCDSYFYDNIYRLPDICKKK